MSQQEDVSLINKPKHERVGMIHGFLWKKSSTLNYPQFSQYWYGPSKDQEQVFRALHRSIQQTKDLPEHRCIELYVFICQILSILSLTMTGYSVYVLIAEQQPITFFEIFSMIFPVAFFVFMQFGPLIQLFGKKKLRNKIIQTIQNCNINQLKRLGYFAEFPDNDEKCCYFFRCCDLFIARKDINTLEIFSTQVYN